MAACSTRHTVVLLAMLSLCAPAIADDSQALADAPLDVRLLAQPVGVVRSPSGVGAGFILSGAWMVAPAGVVQNVAVGDVSVEFDDPLATTDADDALARAARVWSVERVVAIPAADANGLALIQLAPKFGSVAAERHGVLGARHDDPRSGERFRYFAAARDGARRTGSADAVLVGDDANAMMALLQDGAASSGAPLVDERGCLVGVVLGDESGARVFPASALRAALPADAASLTNCSLETPNDRRLANFGTPGTPSAGPVPSTPVIDRGLQGGGHGGGGVRPRNDGGTFPHATDFLRDDGPLTPPNAFQQPPPNVPTYANPGPNRAMDPPHGRPPGTTTPGQPPIASPPGDAPPTNPPALPPTPPLDPRIGDPPDDSSPEPGSAMLLSAAVLALASRRRR